ncbi:MAG: hypothetical protein ABSG35_21725, partial [Syntrophobacteraceae bacterium]
LPTPPRGDAVTFGYREWAFPGGGLSPPRSRLLPGALIPAKAGIQRFFRWLKALDPGLRRGDDSLQHVITLLTTY